MTGRRVSAILGACFLAASPAAAHAPIAGVGSFWNGVLHPLMVPLHLLAIVSVGLLLGQNAPRLSRPGWPAFVTATALGVVIAGLGAPPPAAILATAAAAGILVAIGRSAAVPLLIVVVACGVLVGWDAVPDGVAPEERVLARTGVLGGAVVGVTLAGGLAAALARRWKGIAVRAAGSWVAAACLLLLALEYSGKENLS